MRTDPRAAEVRAIVKHVFAHFLGENKGSCEPHLVEATDETRNKHAWEEGRQSGHSSHISRYPCSIREPEHQVARSVADNFHDGPEIDETIVIDGGRYVARSYRAEDLLAMWLVAVGIVQFYDGRGRMLGTINLFESLRPERLAA